MLLNQLTEWEILSLECIYNYFDEGQGQNVGHSDLSPRQPEVWQAVEEIPTKKDVQKDTIKIVSSCDLCIFIFNEKPNLLIKS